MRAVDLAARLDSASDAGGGRRRAVTAVPLSQIRTDGGTQTRAGLDAAVVSDYAAAMLAGVVFPPVMVFEDADGARWLADGFHRHAAAIEAGLVELPADVRRGSRRDALLFSVGANQAHGLRRSNADKRAAVLALLNDAEWRQWSDREVARRCGVTHPFVSSVRGSLETVTSETAAIGASGLPVLPRHDRARRELRNLLAAVRAGDAARMEACSGAAQEALTAVLAVDEVPAVAGGDAGLALRLYASQARDTELERLAGEVTLRAGRAVGHAIADPLWLPEAGYATIGTARVGGLTWTAFVIPSVPIDGREWWYSLVMWTDGPEAPASLVGTKKPTGREHIESALQSMSFPIAAATWTTRAVSDEPDADTSYTFDRRWSWPHLLFDSRAAWTCSWLAAGADGVSS